MKKFIALLVYLIFAVCMAATYLVYVWACGRN